MKNFLKASWEVSAMPIASVIPLVSLPLLPFHPLYNFLIGLVLCFIMVYFFIRAGLREDSRNVKAFWYLCTACLAGFLPFFCLIFLPFHPTYNFLIGLVVSFIMFYFFICVGLREDRRNDN